ncbi:MAG: bis(5'-nucleosyl)-tetraphosphatase (symmetrical) YqeK [Elusimicrobia bacterium]|nr:bis(5'-nucleosyl)-tetraphosphatase (symmetrical) YqeK [Elusimicrobiota bacterium]
MRILVFGGSFDPPHKGHAALLLAAVSQLRPDRILIVPAYQAPLKGRPGASASDRLRMIKLGLLPTLPPKWRSKTRLELSEHGSRRTAYTVDTLGRFKRRFKNAELHFVTGSDSAATFPRWKNPAKLKTLCRWWTAMRPGTKGGIPSFFGRIKGRMPDISSTQVRRRLAFGEPVSNQVAAPVMRLIDSRDLYATRLISHLKRSLKPQRLHHTLCVAELAEALARRWRLDAEKARLSGLLHDLGRSVPVPDMPAYARRHKIKVPALDAIARHNPLLAHAHISAALARGLGFSDEQALSAVRKHTLGASSMSKFDKLLFVADATSKDRNYKGVVRLRRLAEKDLDRAFAAVVENKLGHVRKNGLWVHPSARSLWNSLRK